MQTHPAYMHPRGAAAPTDRSGKPPGTRAHVGPDTESPRCRGRLTSKPAPHSAPLWNGHLSTGRIRKAVVQPLPVRPVVLQQRLRIHLRALPRHLATHGRLMIGVRRTRIQRLHPRVHTRLPCGRSIDRSCSRGRDGRSRLIRLPATAARAQPQHQHRSHHSSRGPPPAQSAHAGHGARQPHPGEPISEYRRSSVTGAGPS